MSSLFGQARVILYTAYGSHRHLGVYRELGLQPDQIFIHGKASGRKSRGKQDENCQVGFLTLFVTDFFFGNPVKFVANFFVFVANFV